MLLTYIRDGLREEEHDGYVYSFSKGFLSKNKTTEPFYLRSCAKPLQSVLLIIYNAINKYNFTPEEIALCCASHTGDEEHLNVANSILKKTGLNINNIKCGIHPPLSEKMRKKLEDMHQEPTVLHNNCSGKHLMFLSITKLNNWDLNTYDELTHPVQQETANLINQLCETDVKNYPITADGCGVPIFSMPLKNIVTGYINLFTNPKYEQIKNAILKFPKLAGGENRLDTIVIENGNNNLIAKVGAGGLCAVVNLKEKDAFIVKINDCSENARKIVVYETLKRLGWADIPYDRTIKTLSGKGVGTIKTDLLI
ncbi:asparaginase [bacterium]|nr:asparaginase [bacterium]